MLYTLNLDMLLSQVKNIFLLTIGTWHYHFLRQLHWSYQVGRIRCQLHIFLSGHLLLLMQHLQIPFNSIDFDTMMRYRMSMIDSLRVELS